MSPRSSVRDNTLHATSVVSSFTLLYILFFGPVLFTGKVLGSGDTVLYYLPNFILGAAFWDPLIMGGFPVAADPQAMTWYPLSMFFSSIGSWNGFVLSAYVLASCFTYGYMYTLTSSRLAAAVSGIVYGMSGFMMAHLGHTTIVHAAAWIPLLMWVVESLVAGFKPFWFVAGTVTVACGLLSGHPQILLYGLALSGLYTAVRCRHAPSGWFRLCGAYAVMVILGVGLAALQIVPTAELARLSLRSTMSFAVFASYSLPVQQSVELLFPCLFGSQYPGQVYTVPYFGDWNRAELTGYVGLLPLMLAAFGVIARFKKSVAWFWVAVSLFALVLVLGDRTPFAKMMYTLPGFNKFQVQARHFVEFTMAVSALAGLGVAAIKNRTVTDKYMAVVVTTLGSTILLSFGLIVWRAETLAGLAAAKGVASLPMLPWSNPALGIPFAVFGLGAVTLVVWLKEPASTLRTLLLLVSLAVDLGSFGWFCEWKLLSRHRDDFRAPDLAHFSRTTLEATHQRIAPVRGGKDFDLTSLGMREEIPPNLHKLWGVSSVGGYGPLLLSRVSEALSMLHNGEITGHWYRPEDRTFDIMAISRVSMPLSAFRPLTTKGQGISWSAEDVGLWLGAECGTMLAQDSLKFGVPVSVKATALGVVSSIACGPAVPDNTEVVSVVITDQQGGTYRYGIRAGHDTSEWAFDCADVLPHTRHKKATVFLSFPASREGVGPCQGHRYVSTLGFGREIDVRAVELAWTGLRAGISIQKLTLYNENSGLSYPVSELSGFLSDATRWRVDREIEETRVYENIRAMPRAWLVPETLTLKPDQVLAALKTSRLPDGRPFDPARIGLVEEPLELRGEADATAEAAMQYATDTVVEIRTRSSAVSFLVLSDVFYPGWSVTVDDAPSRVYQADYVLRGVAVPAGEHLVRFEFTPRTFYAGLGITVLSSIVTLGIPVFGIVRRRRKTGRARKRTHAVER